MCLEFDKYISFEIIKTSNSKSPYHIPFHTMHTYGSGFQLHLYLFSFRINRHRFFRFSQERDSFSEN